MNHPIGERFRMPGIDWEDYLIGDIDRANVKYAERSASGGGGISLIAQLLTPNKGIGFVLNSLFCRWVNS